MLKSITYIEICIGFGLGLGPVIGAFFYQMLQYEYTMYVFALINCSATIVCAFMLPNKLNLIIEQKQIENYSISKVKDITWTMLFKNKEVVFTMATCFIGTFNVVFFEGWITTELERRGMQEGATGYVLGAMCFMYLFMCLILPYTCGNWPRKFLYTFCMFGLAFSLLFLGPTQFIEERI